VADRKGRFESYSRVEKVGSAGNGEQ